MHMQASMFVMELRLSPIALKYLTSVTFYFYILVPACLPLVA